MFALLLSSAVLASGAQCPVSIDAERWTELTRREDLVVVLRVSGECHHDLEVLVIDRGGEVEVEVIEASGRGFDEQLAALRKRNPDELPSTLCSSLRLTPSRVTSEEQPALIGLVKELYALSVSPVLPPEIYLDGIHYDLRIASIGNISSFQFSGRRSEGTPAAALAPLETWSRKLLGLVGSSCDSRP